MTTSHKGTANPGLPLTDSTVAREIVAIHHCQLTDTQLNGLLLPTLLRDLSLQIHYTKCEKLWAEDSLHTIFRRLWCSVVI